MCLKTRPGTSSSPTALWLGVRRKASCMMARVIQPEIIGIEDVCVGRTCPSRGKGVPCGSVGSGIRAAVSICAILATTSSGAVMIRPVVSSRITERYVGRAEVSVSPSDVRRVDLSGARGFFTNKRSRGLPYRRRRRLRACRTRILVALCRPLTQV